LGGNAIIVKYLTKSALNGFKMGYLFNQRFSFLAVEAIENGVGELNLAIFAAERLSGVE
jgi:hypothetical protein